jgi:glycine/D-amino acid oxidase-like deaminating enzyme
MYNLFRKRGAGAPSRSASQGGALQAEFDRYWRTIRSFVESVRLDAEQDVYLFGAHAFTITFLKLLERAAGVRAVLDNEPTKHHRRLSGSHLICRPPQAIKDDTVVVYMGAYTEEICRQLKSINPRVRLVRLDQFAQTLAAR